VFVFTLFRGLRWELGSEWEQYYLIFQASDFSNLFSLDRGGRATEWGYVFLNALVKALGGNYTTFLLLSNLFVLSVFCKFAWENSKTPIYVFVLLMFSTQFFPSRIGIAVPFAMLGFSNFIAKNYLRTAAYTFFAISIHVSAAVCIPAYFLILAKKIPTSIAVASSIVLLTLVQIGSANDALLGFAIVLNFIIGATDTAMAEKFQTYLNYEENKIVVVSYFLNAVIFIAILIPFGRIVDKMKDAKAKIKFSHIYNAYFVFASLGILFSLPQMVNLKRMQNYFFFAFPLLFAFLVVWCQKKMPRYGFVFTQMLTFYAVFRSYTLFFGDYPELHFPYNSIFDY
jgi:hypothetical protein